MKNVKKQLSICLAAALLTGLLTGCAPADLLAASAEAPPAAPAQTAAPTPQAEETAAAPAQEAEGDPVVYRTADISPEGLQAVYEALDAVLPAENVAVKISTGETGSNYLRPELIGDLVASVHGTIVECNTAYGGQRANTAYHLQLAQDHGYTAIADVDILDAEGSLTLPVEGGSYLAENYVGANLANYDYIVVLSHFKGHSMAGFGGAIKNISIGIASAEGKAHIHSGARAEACGAGTRMRSSRPWRRRASPSSTTWRETCSTSTS